MTEPTSERAGHARRPDRGALAVMMMFVAVVALTGVVMLVDGGRWLSAHRRAVDVAAASARAAAGAQNLSGSPDDESVVRRAVDHAAAAGIAHDDVSVAVLHRESGAVDVVVRVTVRTPAALLSTVGVPTVAATAAVTARLVYSP
jgi:Flp pilus assembly protein TadG